MTETLRRTPLYEIHVENGGRIVPFAGWEMPVQFAGIKAEHNAVRTAAGIFDVSHMCEFRIRGANAVAAIDRLVTNDVHRLRDGEALYSPMCTESGGIVDDLLVHRISEDNILLVVNAACREKDFAHVQKHLISGVDLTDESDDTGQIALQGPLSPQILAAVEGGAAFTTLAPFTFKQGTVAGISCLVARTGYTAEDGFELYCPWAHTPALFSAVFAAGEPFGLVPIGLGARDTLRLEGRMSLYGNELDLETTPLEAGLAWTVKLDKPDFIGKAALVRQKTEGLRRKLVGFEMVDRAIARHGYPVVAAEDGPETPPIGVVTSGSPSPTLGTNIGLAYVPDDRFRVGDTFNVVIREQTRLARVVKTPFYKRA